jgi:pimeloyl-ACP methyl ester carboxylesterase
VALVVRDGDTKLLVYRPISKTTRLPVRGARPAVIFVPGHGAQVRPRAYSQLRRYLGSHGFTTAMFDFPTKGAATSPSEWRARFEGVVAQLERQVRSPGGALYRAIDLDRLALGGHSFGGAFAVEVAAIDSGRRFKTLFLFASGSDADKGFLRDARRIRVPTLAFGGSYDFSVPPLENDLKVVQRVQSSETAFVLVQRGNHMNAPTDMNSTLVGKITWRPRYTWVGFFPVFVGYDPVFEPDPTKTAISGPLQKGITFPILVAWLKRHLQGRVDSAGWLSTRLERLKQLGVLGSESFSKSSSVKTGLVSAVAGP